jgi:hypothetical protein
VIRWWKRQNWIVRSWLLFAVGLAGAGITALAEKRGWTIVWLVFAAVGFIALLWSKWIEVNG